MTEVAFQACADRLQYELRNPEPVREQERRCKRWACTQLAWWRVWAEYRCNEHAIEAGFIPGPRAPRQTRLAA